MSYNVEPEPPQGNPETLEMDAQFFLYNLEEHMDDLVMASDAMAKWIRKDRITLGLDPQDIGAGLENHRICDMVFTQMKLDELYNHLVTLEKYWVSTSAQLPGPGANPA